MVVHKNQRHIHQSQDGIRFKKSLLAACVMALSVPSFAQDEASENVEEIVVSGIRQNLQNAQDIKRNANTFVDSISASDIGSLPDRSVLEAMQRLPGVSIERFQAPEDPDHFGVEGSGAVIRGMSATRSEFNGRDSFTANSGRGLNFQDVPPELMGGVDLYKNQSADMIEGGIGGTVSLRTRKPFDSPDRVIAISGDVSYGDLAEESSPTISGLYSDRWDTDIGEFGLLLNLAHSELIGTSHGIQSDSYIQHNAVDMAGAEAFVGDGTGKVWVPNGSNFFMKNDDRTRKGYAAAIQWENPDDTILASFQFMRSDATLSWTENAVKYQGDNYLVSRVRPATGTEFAFDDNGVFLGGTMLDGGGWRGGGQRLVDGSKLDAEQFGNKFQADTRYKYTNTVVDDYAFNVKFTPTDQWEFEVDYQYIAAETLDDDLQIALGLYAAQDYDTRGDTPHLVLSDPWLGRRDADPAAYGPTDSDPNPYPGFSNDPQGDANFFQDPENYWWRSAMDHYERSEGDSAAVRFDSTYHFEDAGLLRSVKAGIRYAEREQTVRSTSYNWGTIGAEWKNSATIPFLTNPDVADQSVEYVDWSDFHRGGVAEVPGDLIIFPTEALIKDVLAGRKELYNSDPGNGPWIPYRDRDDQVFGGIFQMPEVYNTRETNEAAYVRLDFGSDETAVRFSGNIGLRYVKLGREALGSVQYPDLLPIPIPAGAPTDLTDREAIKAWGIQQVEDGLALNLTQAIQYSRDSKNWLTADERGFGNDAYQFQAATADYSTVLPSLNLKLELTDDLIGRFAVSKAIAQPDMSEVRNQAILGLTNQLGVIYMPNEEEDPDAPEETDPKFIDTGRDIQSVSAAEWKGSGGNPKLKPMESTQYDLSLEWYFANVGSLTGTIFYKDLSNFFISGAFPQTYTNPISGVTQTADFEGTTNGGGGTMKGFEIAYQQFFDMLPEPWDGLGVQVNYTYIKSEGVPNFSSSGDPVTELEPGEAEGMDAVVNLDMSTLPLRGQSKDTFNFVAMYEKNDWSIRFAYNWRSKYLLTTRDAISKYPIWNDDAGFLDGSIFYNVNDNIKVGLQFTNLLDTQTKTLMILDNEGTEAGRSWFVNDRRAALIVRATF